MSCVDVRLQPLMSEGTIGLSVKKMITAGVMLAAVSLVGCNTISGAGKDMSSAGHAVSRAAKPVN
jgi:predicted small secreted protein